MQLASRMDRGDYLWTDVVTCVVSQQKELRCLPVQSTSTMK